MRLEMRNGTNLRAIDSFMNELNSSLSMNGDVKFFSSSEYQLVISMNVRFELVQWMKVFYEFHLSWIWRHPFADKKMRVFLSLATHFRLYNVAQTKIYGNGI